MKYCQYCGNELHDEAIFCPSCKRMLEENSSNKKENLDLPDWLYILFSILFPVIGIVFYFLLDDKKLGKNCLILGIIFTILWIALGILLFIGFWYFFAVLVVSGMGGIV